MATITNDISISRPPDEVWAVLGDPTAAPEWVPGISAARMEGGRRICTTADGAEIHEELDVSDERRSFSYSQPVHPLGLKRSTGTLAVVENGLGSTVSWTAEVEFADGAQEAQFLPMLEQGYAAALESLKARVER
jgi:uncharacterized protein YndB with AHSA1/START domain